MTDFLVESNRGQVLRYVWRGQRKQCAWSESETGRFDVDTMGQDAEECAFILNRLGNGRDREKHYGH